MIDISSGDFQIADGIIIKHSAKAENLIDFLHANNAEIWDVGNGWVHYYLKNYKINNKYFFFDFMFCNEILNRLDFGFYPQPVNNANWNDWSEETELQKKAEYEQWLNNETGGINSFTWGYVSAYYDSKSGGSGIMINYGRG